MTPPAAWQFALEVHPPGWRFPSGASWLAGWIYAGPHRFVTDLRAWVDGRAFLGLPGLPKPGLDEKFLGRPGPPYAGFVFQVEPHRGARHLRLEARDPAGAWTEFFRTEITVAADAKPFAPPAPWGDRLPELMTTVLRLRRQRPALPWRALAEEAFSGTLATPLNTLPVPPFHGALEEPRDTGWLRYGRLSVTGWLAHRHAGIRRISALVDALQEATLLHGLPRSDIDSVFADLPGRERSQFIGHVDLPANQSSPALLKVFAELDSGEKHLVFAQRFQPRVIAGADLMPPPFSWANYGAALVALADAARRYQAPAGPLGPLVAGARAAWSHYRSEAPAARARARPRPAPRLATPASTTPPRILIVTHNLNFEGAPWFVFELARHLARDAGAKVRVTSPVEGPMRAVFEQAGMPVDILDLQPVLSAPTREEFQTRLRTATAAVPWGETDLVVANTMVAFWAVHAARAAGKPAVLYVHESAPVRRFFEPMMARSLFPVVEDAFRHARQVVFTAAASQAVYAHLESRGNFALLPSWVDVERIDAFADGHSPTSLRRKHGLDPEAVLLVNIGSVCERKGQHIFIRAIELLKDELRFTYPGRKIEFLMVGARPGVYLDSLQRELAMHGLDQARFVPESGEIYDYYRLADILVCTSFEESFPRVLLESAVFRLPIITTNVNGIAEMLGPDDAWITAPGDRHQLGDAIKQALVAHYAGDRRKAEHARASIVRRFAAAAALPQHVALLRAAAR